jgi:16S rRNA (cytosine1402-N4)-methyltransferase
MEQKVYHIPALLDETLQGLSINPDGVYVDVTYGGGGHSRAILERLSSKGRLVSFDQDADVLSNLIDDQRFLFVRSNFKYITNFLKYHSIDKVDGVLADLGVSFHHFDDADRGFSFRFDGLLDMRMNNKSRLTAAMLLNTYQEESLADVFYLYGELHNSRKIAKLIVNARSIKPLESVSEFLEVIKPCFFKEKEKKDLARVFQALRIEVNKEMEVLKSLLHQSTSVLRSEGRLVMLTYHSLEDRMVKNFIKTGNVEGKLAKDFYGNALTPYRMINNKVIVPSDEEIQKNPRARSAKLRIAALK